MEISKSHLLLQRNVNVKAIVTPRWKEEAQQTLQAQLNQTDTQLQQLEMQMQQVLTEVQRQTLQPGSPEALQQSENIRMQFNQRKSELLEQKNQSLQQLQQIQLLELNEEVQQGQIGSVFQISPGDNLIEMMNVEILLRDGVVEEIRGVI
jgi:hypothetical protein